MAEREGEVVVSQAQNLGNLDINLVPMSEVGSDLSKSSQDSSFHGFKLTPRAPAQTPSPKIKPTKNKPSKTIIVASLGDPNPSPGEPSSEPPLLPPGAPPGPSEIPVPTGIQPDPGNTELLIQKAVEASMRSFVSGYTDQLEKRMGSLRSEIVQDLRSFHPTPDPSQQMPLASELPPQDPLNPWRDGRFIINDKGTLYVEGLGFRPMSDFDYHPSPDAFPNCWLRLRPDASIRMDKIPKETVIFPLSRAQTCALTTYSQADCVNFKAHLHKGAYTMFTTPPDMITPFSSKALEAVLKAIPEDGSCPTLKEWDSTSPVFPNDSDAWKGVASTFTVGKLPNDCASSLFNEDLPKLPNALLNTEYEARLRLARSLHTMALTETLIHLREKDEALSLIAKTHGLTVTQDLHAFAMARRALRKHIFEHAKVRHEPNRLINSSLWGESLFPPEVVRDALDGAEKANQSLRTRWGLSFGSNQQQKRKSSPGSGPQPKGSAYKRFKLNMLRAQMALPPPPASFNVPPPPLPSYTRAPAQPTPSPAHNPYFEQGHSGFRQGQSYGGQGYNRGGRGRGSHPRTKNKGHKGRGRGSGPSQ